jgi:hypothetical protein
MKATAYLLSKENSALGERILVLVDVDFDFLDLGHLAQIPFC